MPVKPKQLKKPPRTEPDRERIVRAVIEDIRPNLRRDGGDCQLVAIDGSEIMIRLSGACVFCELSNATLEGIQARLTEGVGEFVRLVPVAGAAKARH
ncbi:NifU family protein [Bradyrhizobium genosp. P]|uniref:NifU family protein n=1 Tax=Bradyrhizobium genosp. P TaxID=83641 RepID=UPI003CF22F01